MLATLPKTVVATSFVILILSAGMAQAIPADWEGEYRPRANLNVDAVSLAVAQTPAVFDVKALLAADAAFDAHAAAFEFAPQSPPEVQVAALDVAPQSTPEVQVAALDVVPQLPPEVQVAALDLEPQSTSDAMEELAESDPQLTFERGAEGEGDTMIMLADVLFDYDAAALNPAIEDVLGAIAGQLTGIESLEIQGHTDSRGSDAYNLVLAEARATAVQDWLLTHTALPAEKLSAVGIGEGAPVAQNVTDDGADNPEGRALNRRVAFIIK